MTISKNTTNHTRRQAREPRDILVSTKRGTHARLFSSTAAAYRYAKSLVKHGRGWSMELLTA